MSSIPLLLHLIRVSSCITPAGGPTIISFGRSPSRRPRLYVIHCHFCAKYELICSFNTFYIFRVFSEFETPLVHCLLSFLYQIQTNLFILYILYVGHLLSGMLLLVQDADHLMFIIPLPITVYSSPACADHDVISDVSSYPASRGTDHYISFVVFSQFEILLVHYLLSFLYQIRTNLFILYILYLGHLLLAMLLLVQGAGHLMYKM